MGRNVENKARARDFQKQARLAEGLSSGTAEHFIQEDIFFKIPAGRLKLRIAEDGSGELIQYERSDSADPTESHYVCFPTSDPNALKEVLTAALGIRAVVKKKRTVHLAGQTRIHLDQVEGLGNFIELEVVLESDQDPIQAEKIAEKLMVELHIEKPDLIRTAYVDLLESRVDQS